MKLRATEIDDLLDYLSDFEKYRNSNGFDRTINSLKAYWYGGIEADGANWVIEVVKKADKNGNGIFPVLKTNFEINNTIFGTVRRYDAVVDDAVTLAGGRKVQRFFELKSYASIPPSNFNIQFVLDLRNPNIENIDQLRWYFDGAKNTKSQSFIADMEKAIDRLDLSTMRPSDFTKYNVTDAPGMKVFLKSKVNTIFYQL